MRSSRWVKNYPSPLHPRYYLYKIEDISEVTHSKVVAREGNKTDEVFILEKTPKFCNENLPNLKCEGGGPFSATEIFSSVLVVGSFP